MKPSVYVAIPLMAALTLLQTAVLPHFPILGLFPQLPFLVAISWALLRGVEEGLMWAFVGGLFLDLMSITPLGISSLSFMVGILAVIWIQQALPSSRFLLPVLLTFLATAVALLVNMVLLRLFQRIVDFSGLIALFPLALLHGLFILPVHWSIFWIDRVVNPRRVGV